MESIFSFDENGKIENLFRNIYKLIKGKISHFYYDNTKVDKSNYKKLLEKEGKLYDLLRIYIMLKEKGYEVGAGFKFGAPFRIYDKEEDPEKHHSRWVLDIIKESISIYRFSSLVRVAHSTRKNLILVVKNKGSYRFFEVRWVKP